MVDETFIVASAFFAFVALAARPIGRMLSTTLDERAKRIEKELSEAVKLREEAQVMLSEYKKKYREIEEESATIIENAKAAADAMRVEAEDELQKSVKLRLGAAQEKINRAEELAIQGVQRQVVDVAMNAAKKVISEKMRSEADDALIKLALKDVNRIVH